jgi:glycosyltransferase involved in cell wall biosynthesis
MRIVHVAETLIGGIASHIEDVAVHQIRRFGERNVRVVVPQQHRQFIGSIPDACVVTFDRRRRDIGSGVRLMSTSLQTLRDHQPHIVHLHSSIAGGVVRLARFAVRGKERIVYCPHGWAFAADGSRLKRHGLALIERALSRVTTSIVTVSDHEASLGQQFGIPGRLMTTVLNGVSSTYDQDGGSPLPLSANKTNFLFVGRLDRQKGFPHLVGAARELVGDNVHFHVIGKSVVSEPFDTDRLPSNITLHGWVSRDTVLATMRAADGLVLPSLWEGLSITGIEAMRAGIAVIASNLSSNPELVEHGKTGLLVDLGTKGSLTAALRDTSRETLRQMGTAGRERFKSLFTLEQQVERLSALYERVHAS